MQMNEHELQYSLPIPALDSTQDIVIKLEKFDGKEYDDLVEAIVKRCEGSRGIGSFISVDFETVVRLETHGYRGIKCYEGIAKDTKGRTWFLKIIDEYRAYDVGMEAEELLEQFISKYVKQLEVVTQ